MMSAEQFKQHVMSLARMVRVQPKEIHIRSMKRKWASCSSRGRLTFDQALLRQPAEVRAKAVLHELLHLKLPNHGKMFNALLEAYVAKVTGTEAGGGEG